MKKKSISLKKLELSKDRIGELSAANQDRVLGGATFKYSNCAGCPPESQPEPKYDIHTNFVGYVWVCDQPPASGNLC